jgi:hypothetical protein
MLRSSTRARRPTRFRLQNVATSRTRLPQLSCGSDWQLALVTTPTLGGYRYRASDGDEAAHARRGAPDRRQHREAAGLFEQEVMRSRLQPPKQMSLCAIAAALMLSFLLPGPAAGVTQRYCLPSLLRSTRWGRRSKRPADVPRRGGRKARRLGTPRSTSHLSIVASAALSR